MVMHRAANPTYGGSNPPNASLKQKTMIQKFTLPITRFQNVEMPLESKILSVANEDEMVVMYAQLSEHKETTLRPIEMVLTNKKSEFTNSSFIGTVKLEQGVTAIHVFAY